MKLLCLVRYILLPAVHFHPLSRKHRGRRDDESDPAVDVYFNHGQRWPAAHVQDTWATTRAGLLSSTPLGEQQMHARVGRRARCRVHAQGNK